eukprot:3309452-Pyramimonas_sp.AAC.1
MLKWARRFVVHEEESTRLAPEDRWIVRRRSSKSLRVVGSNRHACKNTYTRTHFRLRANKRRNTKSDRSVALNANHLNELEGRRESSMSADGGDSHDRDEGNFLLVGDVAL